MKIKNIESQIEISVEFGEWIREYVRKDTYNKWRVISMKGVYKVYSLKDNGESIVTLMSYSEANKHKNQFNSKVRVSKEDVSIEFYEKYLKERILKDKQDLNQLSFFKRVSKRLQQLIKPKQAEKNKIPFTRAESVQIKIGIIGIVLMIATIVIGFFK